MGRPDRKDAHEREHALGIFPAPDVDQHIRERDAEVGDVEKRSQNQKRDDGVEKHPGELLERYRRRLFEETAVSLHEVDMEEEVKVEGAKVKERRAEAPEL